MAFHDHLTVSPQGIAIELDFRISQSKIMKLTFLLAACILALPAIEDEDWETVSYTNSQDEALDSWELFPTSGLEPSPQTRKVSNADFEIPGNSSTNQTAAFTSSNLEDRMDVLGTPTEPEDKADDLANIILGSTMEELIKIETFMKQGNTNLSSLIENSTILSITQLLNDSAPADVG